MFGLIGGYLFYYYRLPILSHGRDGAANLFFWRPSLSRERLGTDQLNASLLKGGASDGLCLRLPRRKQSAQ
jgi:hypothetical protein